MRSAEDFNELELLLYNKMMSKVEFAENGCWLSQWTVVNKKLPNADYRKFDIGHGKAQIRYFCHRLSCALSHGPFTDVSKSCALHSCDTPSCCNPEHLRWGSYLENMQDKNERGRNFELLKTECPFGHFYTPENTRIREHSQRKGTSRNCRKCANAAKKQRLLYRLEVTIRRKISMLDFYMVYLTKQN